jgi:uncharacterized membrane protein
VFGLNNQLDLFIVAAIITPSSIVIWSNEMTKTLTFTAVHFSVAFTVGYLLTGSVAIGGAIALVEPACNTVAYLLHEKIVQQIEQGEPVKFEFFHAH